MVYTAQFTGPLLHSPPVERPHADRAADGGDEVEDELRPGGHRPEVQRVRQQEEREQVAANKRVLRITNSFSNTVFIQ